MFLSTVIVQTLTEINTHSTATALLGPLNMKVTDGR